MRKEKKMLDSGKKILHYLDWDDEPIGNQIVMSMDGRIIVRRWWVRIPTSKHTVLHGLARWLLSDGTKIRSIYEFGELRSYKVFNKEGKLTESFTYKNKSKNK